MPKPNPPIVLIAGPTASGKSALALQLARERGGIVINADSMQVYRELRLLTARPSIEEEALAPHRLYGHVSAGEAYSVSRWLEDVRLVLDDANARGRTAIFVGGTGLYFKALTEGLSPVPAVPHDVRQKWRDVAAGASPGHLHAILRERDPLMAARLPAGDVQRIARALEVHEATGVSLSEWQLSRSAPLVDANQAERLRLTRSRAELYARCDRRLDQMVAAGALDEVRHLLTMELDDRMPAMRALGVRSLGAHVRGFITLAEAVSRAKTETRQYVKRQETWARKFMSDWSRANPELAL
ncbi:MAG: tRNA (adenosine(37)-N6)-dimethylallyltransferase MiaA [Hyphomicrobiaceae bacterium]